MEWWKTPEDAAGFHGPFPIMLITQNDVNFLMAAGKVGGFDPRLLVTASHDDASRKLGSGVYKSGEAGSGKLKSASWSEFMFTYVNHAVVKAVQEYADAHPNYTKAIDALIHFTGSYQDVRKLMV